MVRFANALANFEDVIAAEQGTYGSQSFCNPQ